MPRWAYVALLSLVSLVAISIVAAYPIGSLKCCNTLARPDNLDACVSKIGRDTICPQTRNQVCVMERIGGFSRSTCGKTDSGDFGTWQNYQPNDGTYSDFPLWAFRWDDTNSECVYRKCAEQCPDGSTDPGAQKNGKTDFEYEGRIYRRQWFCCNDRPMCNSARSSIGFNPTTITVMASLLALLLGTSRLWTFDI